MAGVCIPFGIGVLSFPCQTVSSGNRAFSLYSSTLLLFSFLLFSSLLFSSLWDNADRNGGFCYRNGGF